MATFKGTIIWVGDSGSVGANQTLTFITPIDWAAFPAFITSLENHTLCNRACYVRHSVIASGAGAPGASADVSKTANIYFRDPSDLSVHVFSYPAPIAADIETVATGKRVKKSAVVAIVGYINTMLSTSYVPLYGTYYERK